MVLISCLEVLTDGLVDCVSVLETMSCIDLILTITRMLMIFLHSFPEENAAFLDLDVELLESIPAGPQVGSVRVVERPLSNFGRAVLGHQLGCLAEVLVSDLARLFFPTCACQLALIILLGQRIESTMAHLQDRCLVCSQFVELRTAVMLTSEVIDSLLDLHRLAWECISYC